LTEFFVEELTYRYMLRVSVGGTWRTASKFPTSLAARPVGDTADKRCFEGAFGSIWRKCDGALRYEAPFLTAVAATPTADLDNYDEATAAWPAAAAALEAIGLRGSGSEVEHSADSNSGGAVGYDATAGSFDATATAGVNSATSDRAAAEELADVAVEVTNSASSSGDAVCSGAPTVSSATATTDSATTAAAADSAATAGGANNSGSGSGDGVVMDAMDRVAAAERQAALAAVFSDEELCAPGSEALTNFNFEDYGYGFVNVAQSRWREGQANDSAYVCSDLLKVSQSCIAFTMKY
jgi:hypothetical protein